MTTHFFLKTLKRILYTACMIGMIPSYGAPDLTIVGFVEPEGGIGKVPVTILECLGEQISSNFITTELQRPLSSTELSPVVSASLNNPDNAAGKVALLTELLWDVRRKPSAKIPKNSIVKLAYSMLETTQIPHMWVKILNEEFDAVVVPDKYVLTLYQDCGVNIPIFILPIPMILSPYYARSIHTKKKSEPFIFGDASANKNPITLIKAFARAFGNNPNVKLFMRAGSLNRADINRTIQKFGLKNVTIEDGKIALNDYIDRLASFDCYINLSRGEGFSFIPRECFALGIPVIITHNTASMTICDSGFVHAVPSTIKGPANKHYNMLFGEQCGDQFDCRIKDVVKALREVYNNYSEYINKARQGREWVRQYDSTNPTLQALYQTLIKPKNIVLGSENLINDGTITTNSINLYSKYQEIIMTGK